MLKVVHFVQVAPCRSGLYETTREICKGQIEYLKWNARMVDVTGICTGSGEPTKQKEERGIPLADLKWARRADVFFLHTGIPKEIEGTKPTVYFAHGMPEYTLYSQIMREVAVSEEIRKKKLENATPFFGSWGLVVQIAKYDWMKAAITLWRRHKPYWEPYFKKVILGNHFCDLEKFKPEGDKADYVQRPAENGGMNITFADHWRYTAFKDPFQILHGARKFCKSTNSRIHLYAVPKEEVRDLRHPWNSIIHGISEELEHTLGGFYAVHADIASVHRAADLLITPSCDDTRTVIEASACGCPVLARHGTEAAIFHCRIEDPDELDRSLRDIYQKWQDKKTWSKLQKQSRDLVTDKSLSLKSCVEKIESGLAEVL